MFRAPGSCLFIAVLMLAGCNQASQPPRAPAIGIAYAGPSTMNLHEDIDAKTATVAVAHHGDKLEIIGQRRKSWYKVRTAKGVEGWTSNRELLDSAQMERLRLLAAETAGMPSQGTGSAFDAVNVHTEPYRQSTSFIQVHQNEKFDVIAHKIAGRTPAVVKRELIPVKPKPVRKSNKQLKEEARLAKEKKASRLPPLPAPAAPAPPADWLEVSRARDAEKAEPTPADAAAATAAAAPAPMDDWTLIRTRSGQSGWVLTNAIYLQIPDEVAQYAEGHRITSYFSLGKIKDGDEQKDIWLWTTSLRLGLDYDFDGYRVFVWSLKHHRYETAYIQRRERGFFPVLAKGGQFSVCLEQPDGSRVRKQYSMLGNAVRGAGSTPCKTGPVVEDEAEGVANIPPAPEVEAKVGFVDQVTGKIQGLWGKKP